MPLLHRGLVAPGSLSTGHSAAQPAATAANLR